MGMIPIIILTLGYLLLSDQSMVGALSSLGHCDRLFSMPQDHFWFAAIGPIGRNSYNNAGNVLIDET